MDITVSVKIEMDASASLSQMERQIQEAGREAMKEGLKLAILHKEELQAGCSKCGSKQGHGESVGNYQRW